MARVRITPEGEFGKLVYGLMKNRFHKDGTVWEVEDLAEACGVVPNSASKWLKGTAPKNPKQWVSLSVALGCPVSHLVYTAAGLDIADISGAERTMLDQRMEAVKQAITYTVEASIAAASGEQLQVVTVPLPKKTRRGGKKTHTRGTTDDA